MGTLLSCNSAVRIISTRRIWNTAVISVGKIWHREPHVFFKKSPCFCFLLHSLSTEIHSLGRLRLFHSPVLFSKTKGRVWIDMWDLFQWSFLPFQSSLIPATALLLFTFSSHVRFRLNIMTWHRCGRHPCWFSAFLINVKAIILCDLWLCWKMLGLQMSALLVFGITQNDNGLNSSIVKLHRLWREGNRDEFSLKNSY